MHQAPPRPLTLLPALNIPSHLARVFLTVLGYLGVVLVLWQSAAPARAPATFRDRSGAGRTVWLRRNCVACHAIYGLGGFLGPDLTNVISRRGSVYVEAIVRHGQGPMPSFALSADEREQLIAYLATVDASGVFPIQTTPPPVFGQPGRKQREL